MIIQSKKVWIRDALRPAQLEFQGEKILEIHDYGRHRPDVDHGEACLFPGFIDSHTHGHIGVDSATADVTAMAKWQRELPREGVTAFMATTDTESEADNLAIFHRLSQAVGKNEGAEVLGIYMEGNYINPACKGAQNESFIAKPNVEQLKRYIDAAQGRLRRMILAPELDEDFQVLQYALAHGVGVSLGHSAAPYETALRAIELGADAITHTYNGMRQLHHREPSLLGVAFTADEVYTELIADGHHVSWPAVRMLCRAKDEAHLVLVSDASPLKGYDGPLPSGIHIDDQGQFRTDSGALCSSSLRLNDGVRNLIQFGGATFVQAIHAATLAPAKMLKVDDRKGSLRAGKDADVTVTDENFRVIQCYCRGKPMLEG